MEGKQPIKISLTTVICLFIIFTLIVALVGMWCYYNLIDNKEESKNPNNELSGFEQNYIVSDENETKKIDESNDLVYDAEYTYDNLAGKSYTSEFGETYSFEDIVVPYINIKSEDATKANNEIEQLFEELAEKFKKELESTKTWYAISNYKTFINNEVLSIVITLETGGTDVETYEYYTYNFDLNTLNKLSYSAVYENIGENSNNIDSKAKDAIRNCELLSKFSNEANINTYINKSIENYEYSVKDNSIKYFLDNNGELNIIVNIEVPVGRGHFEEIITIK